MRLENACGFRILCRDSHASYGDKELRAFKRTKFASSENDRAVILRALRLSQFIEHVINIGMLSNDYPVRLFNGLGQFFYVDAPFTVVRYRISLGTQTVQRISEVSFFIGARGAEQSDYQH